MKNIPSIDQVISEHDTLPSFDQHVSLLSLPYLFQTTLENLPPQMPYLQPLSKEWLALPVHRSNAINIGIVWGSGHPDVGLRNRSIPLHHFLGIAHLPNVSLFSLQKGPPAQDLKGLGVEFLITDLGSQIRDFADTAACVHQLDLIISADTAIVHLAGAMGKPVWVLLPYGSEWRWLLEREDSPWYPTMRLFRTLSMEEDWESVLKRVQLALQYEFQIQRSAYP